MEVQPRQKCALHDEFQRRIDDYLTALAQFRLADRETILSRISALEVKVEKIDVKLDMVREKLELKMETVGAKLNIYTGAVLVIVFVLQMAILWFSSKVGLRGG